MQQTFYASFPDEEHAEIAIGGLLDAGIAAEDLSAVIYRNNAADVPLQDSGAGLSLVGSGETAIDFATPQAEQKEGSYRYESQIGGGISTSNPDDAVSGIEEMDDASAVAEDMIYPASGASYSSQEGHDVIEGAVTGFFDTTKPEDSALYGNREEQAHANTDLVEESDLDSLMVPGLGLVLGGGALATQVIGAGVATEAGGRPAASIAEYLKDLNVPIDETYKLAQDFEKGGAIVSVVLPIGEVQQEEIEDFLTRSGALNIQLVEG